MNLYQASRQWAIRPDDERFDTLKDLREACLDYRNKSSEAQASIARMGVQVAEGDGDDVRLVSPRGFPVSFTNYSFGQFCGLMGAPSSYMAKLPAPLLVENIRHGMAICEERDAVMKMLLQAVPGRPENDRLILRAATSSKYERIWNYEVADMVMPLVERGWRTPPARPARSGQNGTRIATPEDVLQSGKFGVSVNVGDEIAPAGLYASDHDCFMFLVNENRSISGGPGGTESLWRGAFFKNSEVGAASLTITTFLYEGVCGNHIVWNVSNVREVRIRHVGTRARIAFSDAMNTLRRYIDSSSSEDEARIRSCKTHLIADTREAVIDTVFEKRIASRKDAAAAFELAEAFDTIHGDPKSQWGFAAGMTRLSQMTGYADKREDLDRAAQKIIAAAF